jgi:hypothetical protein
MTVRLSHGDYAAPVRTGLGKDHDQDQVPGQSQPDVAVLPVGVTFVQAHQHGASQQDARLGEVDVVFPDILKPFVFIPLQLYSSLHPYKYVNVYTFCMYQGVGQLSSRRPWPAPTVPRRPAAAILPASRPGVILKPANGKGVAPANPDR